MSVPRAVSLPLVRGHDNTVTVPVTIGSNVAWSLRLRDFGGGDTRGHMVALESSRQILADALSVAARPLPGVTLDRPTGAIVAEGSGSAVVHVTIGQSVGAHDAPGTYGIVIIFEAIPGF